MDSHVPDMSPGPNIIREIHRRRSRAAYDEGRRQPGQRTFTEDRSYTYRHPDFVS